MTRQRFDELRSKVDQDPKRRQRVDRIKSAMHDVLVLAELRPHRKLTQQELAALLDVTQRNVSHVEYQFHIEGGKAKEVWVTPFDQAAADAFWSA